MTVEEAVNILKQGGVIIFPTDTVFGVGAVVSNEVAIEKLYQVKKREADKPTALLVSSIEMAKRYGEFNNEILGLVEKYWPGGLTVVVEAVKGVSKSVLGPDGKVGLRVPDHPVILEIIDELGEAVVASSANFAGGKAPMQSREIDSEFRELVDGVVEGEAGGRKPSTVIKIDKHNIRVLRQGEVKL
jgi:L-threonylcarbamoyladenylate synthase